MNSLVHVPVAGRCKYLNVHSQYSVLFIPSDDYSPSHRSDRDTVSASASGGTSCVPRNDSRG